MAFPTAVHGDTYRWERFSASKESGKSLTALLQDGVEKVYHSHARFQQNQQNFTGWEDSFTVDDGVCPVEVNVKIDRDYTLTFTVNDVKAVSKLEILVDGKTAGVITDYTADGKNYTANVSAAMLAGADKVTLTVRVTNASGASYSGSLVLTVVDEPSIGAVTPLKGSQTGSESRWLMRQKSVR